jgi:hypothetical protein
MSFAEQEEFEDKGPENGGQGNPGAEGKTPGNPNPDDDEEDEDDDPFEDDDDFQDDSAEIISSLEALIQASRNEGFSDKDLEDEIKQLNALKAAQKSKSKSALAPDDDEEEDDGEEGKKAKKTSKKAAKDDDEEDEDDPFGVGLGTKKQGGGKEVEIKDWTDFAKNAKSLGAADPAKLFASAKTWRADSQKLSKVEREFTTLSTALENLPIPVKAAVQAAITGKDYVAEFNANATDIDFLSTFEKNDGEKVARHFFKNRFEKLDKKLEDGVIEKSDYDEEKSDLIELAKDKFETKAESVKAARDKINKNAEDQAKAFSTSVEVTVSKLTEKFPSMSKKAIDQVQSILENDEGVASILYDASGVLKPEAATMIAYMLNGEKLLKAALSAGKKQGASSERQTSVHRSNDKVEKSSSGAGMANKKSPQQQLLDKMEGNGVVDPGEIYRSK